MWNLIWFKLRSFETPTRFMGKWINSNNHDEVNIKLFQTFATKIWQKCMFDGKKKFHTGGQNALEYHYILKPKRVTSPCWFCYCCAGVLLSNISYIFNFLLVMATETRMASMMFSCKFTPRVEKCYYPFPKDAILFSCPLMWNINHQ